MESGRNNDENENLIESKKAKLKDIAEGLKNHYTVKNVSNIFLGVLLDFIKNSNTSHILSKGNFVYQA